MKRRKILAFIIALVLLASTLLVINIDNAGGDVEVSRIIYASDTGDEVNTLMYKPKSATAENPAPVVLLGHGGNDMLEQMTAYCIELSRRGYVCITKDSTGNHNSDIATPGTIEREKVGNYGRMSGFDIIYQNLKNYNFVDQSKIIVMGHSGGGMGQLATALKYQDEIFLSMHLGQNTFAPLDCTQYDFNFAYVVGDADESLMYNSKPQNDTYLTIQAEVTKRMFFNDYETPYEEMPDIEIGKTYTVTGTNGQEYTRTAYRPASNHAYYLVTNDAIQTVVYAITSAVGLGLDEGVNSYEDRGKISTVWQWHDLGYFLIFASVVAIIFLMGAILLDTKTFEGLKLKTPLPDLSFKKKSWQWILIAILMFLAPLLMFKHGVKGATEKFLGLPIKNLWLCGGNNNVIVAWQWCMALFMLAVFLFYHFSYGKKQGGNLKTYGFSTSDSGKFDINYIIKAFAFGLLTVGSGYLAFAIVSAYTKQGIHIATFMVSTISTKRTLAMFMYFLFQIPYFILSSLAFKSLGFTEGGDDAKSQAKSIALTVLFSVGSLFIYWVCFVIYLTGMNRMPGYVYDPTNLFNILVCPAREHVYTMLKMPMSLCMAIATALNLTVTKKTKSIWAGLFIALLFGTWMLISTGELTKYVYW